jgi:hypothetical protein
VGKFVAPASNYFDVSIDGKFSTISSIIQAKKIRAIA